MLHYPDLSHPIQTPKLQIAKPDRQIIGNIPEAYDTTLKLQLIGTHELCFKIPYLIDKNHQLINNPHISQLKNRYLIKFTLGSYIEWFIIDNPSNNSDDNSDFLSIQAFSLEYELSDRFIRNYHPVSILLSDVVNVALTDTVWTLGSIPSGYDFVYRAFDIASESILSFILEIAEKYNLIAQFDTINRQVNFYTKDGIGQNKGLVLSETKYLTSISDNLDNTNFCTRLKVYGKDEITIAKYNPSGKIYIEDYTRFLSPFTRDIDKNILTHSDYWSDELCQAELDYQVLVSSKVDDFNILREQLTTHEETLSTQQSDLNNLNAQLETANNNVQTALVTNLDPENFIIDDEAVNLYTLRATLMSQIITKKSQIINIQDNIDFTQSQITSLQDTLELSNPDNFSSTLLAERNQFIIEKELTDNAYVHKKDLFGFALTKLEEMRIPPTQVKIGIVNFLECISEQHNWGKIVLSDTVTVKHSLLDVNVSAQIIEANYNFEDSDIQLIISNISRIENEDQKLSRLFYRANTVGSLVDINKSEWTNALSNSQDYSDSQTQKLNKALLNLAVDTNIASEDGYITLAESQTLKTSLEQLKSESKEYILKLESEYLLKLEGIETEQDNYSTALINLETELNKWIGKDYYPIYITFNQRNTINALFQGVQNTKSILINRISIVREINAKGHSDEQLENFVDVTNPRIDSLEESLEDIASDDKLTSSEKQLLLKEWNIIVDEYNLLYLSDDEYGVTEERENYNTKFQALAKFLNNDITWVSDIPSMLSDLTTTTDISSLGGGTTFRIKFLDYYNSRTILLNKINSVINTKVTYKVEIISSNGNVFKNGQIVTTLNAIVYRGTDNVTSQIDANRFRWTRVSDDPDGDIIWNTSHFGGTKQVTVTSNDIYIRASFNCTILDENLN